MTQTSDRHPEATAFENLGRIGRPSPRTSYQDTGD